MFKPVFISGIIILFLAASCGPQQEKVKPVRGRITESVYASGIVKSSSQYEVYSKMAGIVTNLIVKEGDLVKKGDPIMQLSDVNARLNTENARTAALYASRSSNAARIQELQMNIEQAAIKLENDSVLYVRQQNLWAQQIGSRNELEQRKLAYKNSSINYQVAKLRYDELQRQISLQELQSGTNLRLALSQTGDYTVRSEVEGRVYNIVVEKGEMVNAQTPVAVIGAAGFFLLELQVDEFDIARIRPGLRIVLTMDSYKGQAFEAVLSSIDPYMNQRTKTFKVNATFTKQPPELYPNLTCEANIIIQEKENSLTIPVSFLLEGDYVLLSKREKRKVSTGLRDYRKVEILDGLTADDVILKPEL